MTLVAAPRVRSLSAEELAYSVDAGTRWAWQLEDDLAALYAEQIASAYATAADALDRVAAHSPAGGLAGASGWTVPDPDELGLSLRELQDKLHETGATGVPQRDAPDAETAIRVEALRRATTAGLELMNISFDARNPLLRGALAQRGQNIGIAATTRREIMASLNSSWEEGDSIPAAAKRLRAAAPEVAKYRSVMIARTELIGVINGGAHGLGSLSNEIASENGEPILLKIWLTAEDESVRDSHQDAGAEYGSGSGIAMDDTFHVGESDMQYPGDPDGAAEDVINCRCALSYEEADADAPRAARDEDAPAEAATPEEAAEEPLATDPEAAERARVLAESDARIAARRGNADLARQDEIVESLQKPIPPARVFAEPDRATPNEIRIDLAGDLWQSDQLRGMFSSQKLADNNLVVQTASSDYGRDTAKINAFVFAKHPDGTLRGGPIAELERTINFADNSVKHDSFFINDKAWQGKGLAKELLRSSVAEYDAAGLTRVEVHAAGQNGRYTWARFGFDFKRKSDLENMREHFVDELARAARDSGLEFGSSHLVERLREAFPRTMGRIEAAEHPWEFAGISLKEKSVVNAAFGKDAMVDGPAWLGELDLTPGSTGRRIFDAYTAR